MFFSFVILLVSLLRNHSLIQDNKDLLFFSPLSYIWVHFLHWLNFCRWCDWSIDAYVYPCASTWSIFVGSFGIRKTSSSIFCFVLLLWYWGLNSGATPWATPPFLFCDGFYRDRVFKTICPGWLWTTTLLISVSWVEIRRCEPPVPHLSVLFQDCFRYSWFLEFSSEF
jgi:hypothetical protein